MLHKLKKKKNSDNFRSLWLLSQKKDQEIYHFIWCFLPNRKKKYNFSVNFEVANFDRKYFFNAIIPVFSIFKIYIHLFKNSEILNRIEFP